MNKLQGSIAALAAATAVLGSAPKAEALPRWAWGAIGFGAGYWAGSAVTETYTSPYSYRYSPSYTPTGYGNYGYSAPVYSYQQPVSYQPVYQPQYDAAPMPRSAGVGAGFDAANNFVNSFFGY